MNTDEHQVLYAQLKKLPAPKHLLEISVNLMEQEALSLIRRASINLWTKKLQ